MADGEKIEKRTSETFQSGNGFGADATGANVSTYVNCVRYGW